MVVLIEYVSRQHCQLCRRQFCRRRLCRRLLLAVDRAVKQQIAVNNTVNEKLYGEKRILQKVLRYNQQRANVRAANPEQILLDNERRAREQAEDPERQRLNVANYREAHPDIVQRQNAIRAAAHEAEREERRANARCALVNIDDRPDEVPSDEDPYYEKFGGMTKICGECEAMYWEEELNKNGCYTRCCSNGAIRLPMHDHPPIQISEALLPHTTEGKIFKAKARYYNNCLAFTSTTLTTHQHITRGPPTLRMSGGIYHRCIQIPSFLHRRFYRPFLWTLYHQVTLLRLNVYC